MITEDDALQAFLDLLPDGKAFEAKNIKKSNMYRLFQSLSRELLRVKNTINLLEKLYIPTEKNLRNGLFFKNWLKSYGIPDDCWPEESNNEITVKYLISKIQKKTTLITRQDYIDLAEYFGAKINIDNIDPFTIKIVLFLEDEVGRWPWTWPHVWGKSFDVFDLLKCVFEKNMPAYIDLIVVERDPFAIWLDENENDWVDEFAVQWTDKIQ